MMINEREPCCGSFNSINAEEDEYVSVFLPIISESVVLSKKLPESFNVLSFSSFRIDS